MVIGRGGTHFLGSNYLILFINIFINDFISQSNKNEITNLSIKCNYVIRKNVLRVLRNTLINNINSSLEKVIQRIYLSTLINTRGD